jgi:hypothetical protein
MTLLSVSIARCAFVSDWLALGVRICWEPRGCRITSEVASYTGVWRNERGARDGQGGKRDRGLATPEHTQVVAEREVAEFRLGSHTAGTLPRGPGARTVPAQVRSGGTVCHVCCWNPASPPVSMAQLSPAAGALADRRLTVGIAERVELSRLTETVDVTESERAAGNPRLEYREKARSRDRAGRVRDIAGQSPAISREHR